MAARRIGRPNPRAYDEYFKAYSVAMLPGRPRENLSYGGKSTCPYMHACTDVLVLIARIHSYSENYMTEEEFAALVPAMQDRVRRTAAVRLSKSRHVHYSGADIAFNHCKRIGRSSLFAR